MVSSILTFGLGVLVGVVYQRSIRTFKSRAERAAQAAQKAFSDS